MLAHTSLALGLSLFLLAPVLAADKPTEEQIKKGLDQVNAHLQKLNGPSPQVRPITDDPVLKTLPGYLCYAVVFRQYPLAVVVPEGLKPSDVFIVTPDGKLEVLTDNKALEKFFKATLKPLKEEAALKDAAYAWLRLSQEFYQDGFYQFNIPDKEITVEKEKDLVKVSGKAVVEPKGGNKGEITAALFFDGDGKLVKVDEAGKVTPGVRPICQATKLLDADSIVRRMAEQDILVMGRSARGYLDEQRGKAGPELRAAIDRVWQRILDEDR
jgi:hypothetical protein